ncbi:MAG: right-handed parallel beta-helix repeat-containing protein [Candidatus Cloacimonadota bacterium]|nr:right-handed parallel beta-helix repeat-containing protein [Candidatus Cloacimonadota bacterium]
MNKKSIITKRIVISLLIGFTFLAFACSEKNNSPAVIVGSQSYSSIREAVDSACSGDTIFLKLGTYTGDDNKNISWNGNEKHLTFMRLPDADYAIIDCEGNGSGFFFANEGNNRDDVIDGITIKNSGDNVSNYNAGIYCFYSHVTVRNCKILNSGWAGIYCEHANPLVENSEFLNNKVGILITRYSVPTIRLNIFKESEYECISILEYGNAYIIDNLLIRNERGVSCYGASAYLVNNTITENSDWGFRVQNGEPVTLTNNIIWNNGNDLRIFNNYYQISYNCISDTIDDPNGYHYANFNLNPLFVDTEDDNFQLTEDSPCINNGTTELPSEIQLPEFDLAGNNRISGISIDIGAYEYQFGERSRNSVYPQSSLFETSRTNLSGH